MTARWHDVVLAQAEHTTVVENNHYFPRESVHIDYLRKSGTHYTCPWKGVCDYYDVIINGEVNPEAAWVYETPSPAAKDIAGKFAFWHGVEIISD